MDNRIIIIDGNSLINRAYYAMQNPMITKEGIYTHGIYGFLNMLSKINRDYPSGYIAVAFDRKAPTFRHLAYDEYKAGRKKMAPELAMQLPLLKDILDAMKIKRLEIDGWEADDIIGTIAKEAEKVGLEPLIITGDKDELQLASDKTKVLITKKGISDFDIFDYDSFVEKYGFTPTQFIDYKGLMGDQSDNIPGIPGVGEKTASKLIKEFGSVENLIENVDRLPKNKLREKIEENTQLAVMSKTLATINVNAPVEFNPEEYRACSPDYSALVEIYTKLEFNSFLKKLDIPKEEISISAPEEILIPDNLECFKDISGEITIKVMTDDSHKGIPAIYGIGVLWAGSYYYISENIAQAFIDMLSESDVTFSGHGLKRDVYALMCSGLSKACCTSDTEIAHYVIDPSGNDYSLKFLAMEYLGMAVEDENDAVGKSAQVDMFSDNTEAYARYSTLCCYVCNEIRKHTDKVIEEKGLSFVYREIELRLIEILAAMEMEGFTLDKNVLTSIGSEISSAVDVLTKDIYEMAGEKFNINSPAQLGTVLFEKLGLPAGKKTQRGYSTSAEVLEKLKDKHPVIEKIMEYRMLVKLMGTYVEGLLPLAGNDGRIHAHFQQTVAATGRLSCTEPNLQNIPVKTEYGRQIRKAFIPLNEGDLLIGADYSQIELRILAHMSEDPGLLDAFNMGLDIHKLTASRVLGVPEDEITILQRSQAKAVNFGVIYGMSGFGLSEELKITRKEADRYISDYFSKHEKVKEFMDSQIKMCQETGYIYTIYGRRRFIKEINATAFMVRQLGERLAMNTPIQGSAADVIKLAMIRVFNALRDRKMKSKLILQIHDELIINAVPEEAEEIKNLLKTEMEKAAELKVKLSVDVNCGESWYELK